MLKLTYTEAGLHLERLAMPLEILVTQRVILALRLGQSLHIEPSRAAFLLPADAPGFPQLKVALQLEPSQTVAIAPVDADYVEISVQGSWLATDCEAHAGIFIAAFADRSEFLLYKLWGITQAKVSFLI